MAHFGRYELLTRLGEGSHAVTWRARLEGVATDVILKLVHPQRDPNFLATFLDEARGVATLSHGNIARLLDFGHEGATCFLVRQLVHGQTLEAVLERAKVKGCPFVPTPVALHIAAKVCDALQYAHSCTELHGEVSPTNVLIGYYGEVKLADFVVARAAQIDSRSDICATGATLYQMLCGQLPAGQLPRALNHRLSPFVAAAVVKAMSAASDGFATAQELGSALKDALAATDPSFTPDRVMRFVDWLFAAELIAEGRGFEPSEEFEAWLDGWLEKKPPSVSVRLPASAQVPVEASAAKVPTEGKAQLEAKAQRVRPEPTEAVTSTTAVVLRPVTSVKTEAPTSTTAAVLRPVAVRARLQPSKWVPIAAALGFVALGASLFALDSGDEGALAGIAITSNPSGAKVTLDGRPLPSTTPLVADVTCDRSHLVVIDLPGYVRWTHRLKPTPGTPNKLHAILQLTEP